MNHSMPGLPVHHQLLEFAQIHVHWVGDAIQPCPQLGVVFALAPFLHSFWSISPLISSSILDTYWPGEFIFQCPIFLLFHTVHGVLKARILKWFAIPFSSGSHYVRPLHHEPAILGGPTWHGLVSLSYTYIHTHTHIYNNRWCFSVTKAFLTLCDLMDCSTPDFLVLHHLLESGQTHVHLVGDALQPSHLLSPTSPALNHSQHQGLFQWISSLH